MVLVSYKLVNDYRTIQTTGANFWACSRHTILPRWCVGNLLSLSRLNHWLPGREAHPEVVQGTADFHDDIADALLPQAHPVFHDATALDTAVDVLDPQPTLV